MGANDGQQSIELLNSGSGTSPYKKFNKSRVSANLKNAEANSRNAGQNRLNIMVDQNPNTVDQMPKKSSYQMQPGSNMRGSVGGEQVVFQSLNPQQMSTFSGGIHNRTSSGYNTGA